MKHLTIDGHNFYNMIVNACNRLEEQKEFVNSLNVFPVPDGDTGTNMSMTFRNAVLEVEGIKNSTIGEMSKKLAKGALMGARGNSGVILSQILRGISSGIGDAEVVDSKKFSHCLMEGANFAYKAVMRPTEGTILTIIRSAGESAVKSKKTDITELLEEVCDCSEEMLNKTPDMLPVLKKAKVVDSGGMGLLIVLKGMYEALKDDLSVELNGEVKPVKAVKTAGVNVDEEIKFGYCTEFIIHSNENDVTEFRNEISKIGDSMVVVNVDDITKVHIHTNDPGIVLSKAVKLGELSKIKIDNMREEHREVLGLKDQNESKESYDEVSTETEHKKYGFISVALGEGISKIFKDLGVDKVIEGGQTMNPSTQDILSSINEVDAENIIVFPNNKNIIMAANQAKELSEKNVYVIPTTTIPQAITCLAEFDYDSEAQANIENLEDAVKNVKTGSITYAVRDTEMDGINIKENDILGLVEGKIKKVGNNVYDVCENVIDSMIDENSELISLYYGKDCNKAEVEKLVKKLEEKYSSKDVQCSFGEQPLYYFIVSVE